MAKKGEVHHIWTGEHEKQLKRLLDTGLSAKDIAELMGFSRATIQNHTRALEIRSKEDFVRQWIEMLHLFGKAEVEDPVTGMLVVVKEGY